MKDRDARKRAVAALGEAGFRSANDAAREVFQRLLGAIEGHDFGAVVNASGLLFLAAIRADGGDLQDARDLIEAAWDSETMERVATALRDACVPDAIGQG